MDIQNEAFKLDPIYFTYYEIESSLGSRENDRYCLDISCDIKTEDENDAPTILVGRVHAYKLLLDIGRDNGWDAFSIFDVHQFTYEIGEAIYNFRTETWKKAIYRHYDDILLDRNLLILTRLEILPQFRGLGIGRKAIKDLYNHFIHGCSLFVLKCFPIQFEYGILESKDNFNKQMDYEHLENDWKKA